VALFLTPPLPTLSLIHPSPQAISRSLRDPLTLPLSPSEPVLLVGSLVESLVGAAQNLVRYQASKQDGQSADDMDRWFIALFGVDDGAGVRG